jgi:hypothetical protein
MRAICRNHGHLRIAAVSAVLLCAGVAGAGEQPQAYAVDVGFDVAPQSLYWYSEGSSR